MLAMATSLGGLQGREVTVAVGYQVPGSWCASCSGVSRLWAGGDRWPDEREAGPAEQRHGAVEGGHGSDRRAGVPWVALDGRGAMLGGVGDGCSEQRDGHALAAVGGMDVQAGIPTPAPRPGAAAHATGRSAGSRCAVRPRPTPPVAGRGRPAAQARVVAPAGRRIAPGGRPCAGCPRSASGGCRRGPQPG